MHFRIIEPGEHYGKLLYRAYRVKALRGKPGKNGGFKCTRHQELFKMLVRVLDLKSRPDRISLNQLRGKVLKISIRTVKQDYRQQDLPEFCWYSVVDDIISITAG